MRDYITRPALSAPGVSRDRGSGLGDQVRGYPLQQSSRAQVQVSILREMHYSSRPSK